MLYAPPALTAILTVQYYSGKLMRKQNRPYMERASFNGLAIFFMLGLLLMNTFGIGSAYLMGLATFVWVVAMFVNDTVLIGYTKMEERRIPVDSRVHLATYFLLAIMPACLGTEGMASFLDLFVPLTGRMGEISPADNIIASIVAFLTFMCLPFAVPLAHRFGEAALRKLIVIALAASVLLMAIFASPAMQPFDKWHPKRLFVHQAQNLTSGEWFMNLGSADPAPGFKSLVDDLHSVLGVPGEPAVFKEMNEHNSDFDILYPVSAFITPYRFRIPTPANVQEHPHFQVKATNEVIDLEAGTRRLTLQIDHPGLIWSVVAFDAEVIEWDLPSVPPAGRQRHHIKEVSRYGMSQWTINLLVKLDDSALGSAKARGQDSSSYGELVTVTPGQGDQTASAERDPSRLWIDYSGLLEQGLYPQKKVSGAGQASIQNFERMDAALQKDHPEVDAMLLSMVAGVAVC